MYYYMKTNSPVLMEIPTISANNDLLKKVFFDLGDYLIPIQINLYPENQNISNWYITKKYLYKSDFPDQKLLCIFDSTNVNFNGKEEEAFVLQFSESIFCIGVLNDGHTQMIESDYEEGEIFQIQYDGLYFWKKAGKNLYYKAQPINFIDSSSAREIYMSEDYLKLVK